MRGNQWYYIAFIGTKSGAIYERFEKKGFNHVIVFYQHDDSYYTVIEHVKTFVNFGIVEKDSLDEYLKDATIIRVRTKRNTKAKWWWWIWTPDTCVTIAKQILGVQNPLIVTPYQLYKHIKRKHKWAELLAEL